MRLPLGVNTDNKAEKNHRVRREISPSPSCVCKLIVVTFSTYYAYVLYLYFFVPRQTLRDEKSSHERDMTDMQGRSEEEASQMKESQARALEEISKKHRVTLENALNNAEKEKNRMLAVSTHTHTHTGHVSPFTDNLHRVMEARHADAVD